MRSQSALEIKLPVGEYHLCYVANTADWYLRPRWLRTNRQPPPAVNGHAGDDARVQRWRAWMQGSVDACAAEGDAPLGRWWANEAADAMAADATAAAPSS